MHGILSKFATEYEEGELSLAWPESKKPLKTIPKPPSPSKLDNLKFLVAAASSRKVKLWGLQLLSPAGKGAFSSKSADQRAEGKKYKNFAFKIPRIG